MRPSCGPHPARHLEAFGWCVVGRVEPAAMLSEAECLVEWRGKKKIERRHSDEAIQKKLRSIQKKL